MEELLSRISDNLWEAQVRLERTLFLHTADSAQSQSLGTILYKNMPQAQTRQNLLHLLPNSTPRLHLFRRRLALAFVFNDLSYMSRAIEDLVDLRRFTALLETDPAYNITSNSDFANLTMLVRILDVASFRLFH